MIVYDNGVAREATSDEVSHAPVTSEDSEFRWRTSLQQKKNVRIKREYLRYADTSEQKTQDISDLRHGVEVSRNSIPTTRLTVLELGLGVESRFESDLGRPGLGRGFWGLGLDLYDTIRYDTIGEFNVDWKAEY